MEDRLSSRVSGLANPGEEGAVGLMCSSRPAAICSITCLSSTSCSCCDLRMLSVSASWDLSWSFLRCKASWSVLASSLAAITILFASSNNAAVRFSSSCSIFFFSISVSRRFWRSAAILDCQTFFSASTVCLRTHTSPASISRCEAFWVSKSRIRSRAASSSWRAADKESSNIVWWLIALMSLLLRVATSSLRSG